MKTVNQKSNRFVFPALAKRSALFRWAAVFVLGLALMGNLLSPVLAAKQDAVHAAPVLQSVAKHVSISEFRIRGLNGGNAEPVDLYSPQDVIISEVAWAGTQAFGGDEWIELYNTTSGDIDLSGWRLEAADGEPSIPLSGTISAASLTDPTQGFFLLERGDDNVVSNVTANQIYNSGLLADSGETLYLLAPDRSLIDTANADGGAWPAGTGAPDFRSMERVSKSGAVAADDAYGWITFADDVNRDAQDAADQLIYGTPGGANWAFSVTPTFTPLPTSTPTNTGTPTKTPLMTPTPSLGVLINEVAWAGTLADANDQWIELYNPSGAPVDMSGWRLAADDGTPDIALIRNNPNNSATGAILPPGDFYLLERGSDSTISDIPADQIYDVDLSDSGDLSNSGEVLRLYDASGNVVDIANGNGGVWPAGSSYPNYASMERRTVAFESSTSWITYADTTVYARDADDNPIKGSPGYANWATTVTPTPSPTKIPTWTPYPTRTRIPTRTATAIVENLVLNEVVPRAGHDWNGDGRVDVYDEYIEVVNIGFVEVDLKNWKLDDLPNQGSSPYILPSLMIKPGQRIAFFGLNTGISLSDGGDTVRLLRPTNQIADALSYTVVTKPDQSWCRLPDSGNQWQDTCFPTPFGENATYGVFPPDPGLVGETASTCLLPDTAPQEFLQAECDAPGRDIWRRGFWDSLPGTLPWLESMFKWPPVFR
jgi:hypothetical protein